MKNMLIKVFLMAGTVACMTMLSGCGASGTGTGNVVVDSTPVQNVVVPAEPEVNEEVIPNVGIETPPTVEVEEPTAPEEVVTPEVPPEVQEPEVEETAPVVETEPVVTEEPEAPSTSEDVVVDMPSLIDQNLGGLTPDQYNDIMGDWLTDEYDPSDDGDYVFGQSGATSDVPMADIQ